MPPPDPVRASGGERDIVITEVKVTPQNDGALRAFVTITFNDSFVIRGLKIIEGAKGRFVAMPSRQRHDGSHHDVAHPITREFRAYMEAEVLTAYAAAVEETLGEEESGQAN